MAIIKAKVCDLHRIQKNQNVEATDTTEISIPGVVYGSTKAKKFTVDVCGACTKEVHRQEQKAQADTEKAWTAMMKLVGTSPEKLRGPRSAAKSEDSKDSKDTEEPGGDSTTSTAQEETEQTAEAPTDTASEGHHTEQEDTAASGVETPVAQWSEED